MTNLNKAANEYVEVAEVEVVTNTVPEELTAEEKLNHAMKVFMEDFATKAMDKALDHARNRTRKPLDVIMQATDELLATDDLDVKERAEKKVKFIKELDIFNMGNTVARLINKEGNEFRKRISTGFPTLDKYIGGGWVFGINVLMGASSTGKSTFAMCSAHSMAKAGHTIFYISTEMSELQCAAKILSRASFENRTKMKATTAEEFLKSREEDSTDYSFFGTQAVVRETAENLRNLYFFENKGDIVWNVDTICEYTRNAVEHMGILPVLIIDYLQMLPLSDTQHRMAEKQALDYTMNALRKLSNDLGLCIIVISSTNRASGYKVKIDSANGCGGIEYGSDLLCGIQFEGIDNIKENEFKVDVAKAENPRRMELKILKNRMGRVGNTVPLDYYTMYHTFVDRRHVADLQSNTKATYASQSVDDDSLPFN